MDRGAERPGFRERTVVAPNGDRMREVRYHNMRAMDRPIGGRPGFYRHSVYRPGFPPRAYVYRGYHYGGVEYFRPMPVVIYQPAFYTWSFGRPVAYSWGWNTQPWYPAYSAAFVPYGTYNGTDELMTDYYISQNLQAQYAAVNAPPDTGAAPVPNALAGPPPPIPNDLKEQIHAQIRAELQEQQQAASAGVNGALPAADGEVLPDALKPTHLIFDVVAPLTVQAGGANCSLDVGDIIMRTGTLSAQGTVTVTVRTSRPSHCPAGASTEIAFNDLNDMQIEQSQQLADGLKMVAENVGQKGLPVGPAPGAQPVPGAQTSPDLPPQ